MIKKGYCWDLFQSWSSCDNTVRKLRSRGGHTELGILPISVWLWSPSCSLFMILYPCCKHPDKDILLTLCDYETWAMKPVLSGLHSQPRWGLYSPSFSVHITNNFYMSESLPATFSHVIKWKKLKLKRRLRNLLKTTQQTNSGKAGRLPWTLWKRCWKFACQKITPAKTTTSDSEVLKGCRWAETSLQRNAVVVFQGHTMNAQVSWSLKTMHSKCPVLLKSGRPLLFSCPAPLLSQG